MNKILKVKNMHCDACKALIKMELEENGFEQNIESIELLEDNKGKVKLRDISDTQLEQIKNTINNTQNYKVI